MGVVVVVLAALAPRPAHAFDIGPLLDTCPTHDPAYQQIRADFEIRRNGAVVGDIPCTEPVSAMPIAQYTDELIVVQGLRAALYMDLGAPLPWAPGLRFYDWLKSKHAGVDIVDGIAFSQCCEVLDGKTFFLLKPEDDANRDFDRGWRGISGNLDLYAHELRHLDGFPHVSCCGITNGCDQTYDETNLSPYGIQWWLNDHWLTGDLYTGFSCLSPSAISDIASWHAGAASGFQSRFCDTRPPTVSIPATPGGVCRSPLGAVDVFIIVDLSGSFIDDLPVFQAQAPAVIQRLIADNPDVHFGLGAFQDYPIPPFGEPALGDRAYYRLVDLTADRTQVLGAIAGLSATSGAGADGPQSQLTALFQAATGAGQDLSSAGFPGASIPPGQQASFRSGASKLILLWTDAAFHQPGDAGAIPYPGPSFAATVDALLALDPAKVIGISSGSGAVADLGAIAAATGAVAPAGGVDCNGDGILDIVPGAPLVCEISSSGPGVGDAVLALTTGAIAAAAPVAVCRDQTRAAAAAACSADVAVDAGSFDPDGGPVTLVQSPPGPYPVGRSAVTLTAYDASGLSGSCVATVTVLDTTPPVIAPSTSAIPVCTSRFQPVTLPAPAVSDACATAPIVPHGEVIAVHGKPLATAIPLDDGAAELPLGDVTVRWTAHDASANPAQLDQVVTITASPGAGCCAADQVIVLGTPHRDELEPRPHPTRSYCVLGLGGGDDIATAGGDDFLASGGGSAELDAGSGDDTAVGGAGADRITGGDRGTLAAYGGPGNDLISAGHARSAEIFGNEGDDVIFGSPGDDTIYPGPGRDSVFAGHGNDTVVILDACEIEPFEILDGGPGTDTLITPVPLDALWSRGMIVVGFEHVVVDASRTQLSECF